MRATAGGVVGLGFVVCALVPGCTTDSSTDAAASSQQESTTVDAIKDTVRRYFDAYNAGDVDGLNDTACSSAQRTEAAAPPLATVVHDIGDPTVTDDTATVPVTMSIDSGAETETVMSRPSIFLTNDAGHWGVCMFERPSSS